LGFSKVQYLDKIPTENFLYNNDKDNYDNNDNNNIRNDTEKTQKLDLDLSKSIKDKKINESIAISVKSHKSLLN
jgi:hypothetical protein